MRSSPDFFFRAASRYTHVSKSVTEEEWAKVYDESFLLARSFRLAEAVRKPVDGIYTRCIELTCEREIELTRETWIGWSAEGDYDSLCMAESYDVQKNMVTEKDFVLDTADAILSTLAPWGEEKRFSQVYRLWWAKTQGELYHMYILAIVCMIEAWLGRKAYVFGDIYVRGGETGRVQRFVYRQARRGIWCVPAKPLLKRNV